jgi:hypothetical protein
VSCSRVARADRAAGCGSVDLAAAAVRCGRSSGRDGIRPASIYGPQTLGTTRHPSGSPRPGSEANPSPRRAIGSLRDLLVALAKPSKASRGRRFKDCPATREPALTCGNAGQGQWQFSEDLSPETGHKPGRAPLSADASPEVGALLQAERFDPRDGILGGSNPAQRQREDGSTGRRPFPRLIGARVRTQFRLDPASRERLDGQSVTAFDHRLDGTGANSHPQSGDGHLHRVL